MKHRDRQSALGLLPRMEARPWADGKTVSYRYHPVGGKPLNLGSDKQAAIQKVLDLNRSGDDRGTVNELWRLYQASPEWKTLAESSRVFYTDCSVQLLKIMNGAHATLIRPADVNKYLRVARAAPPSWRTGKSPCCPTC